MNPYQHYAAACHMTVSEILFTLGHVTLVGIDWDHPGGGGGIFTGLPASSLFGYSGYPVVARFVTDQSTGGGIKMAAAISTVEAAILTILK